jgi:uncharacterized damage-inducible protein DinB
MDFSSLTNPEAQRFAKIFFTYREINKEVFKLIPEDKFDFRLVDTPDRKSDSPRETLAHLINIETSYLLSAQDGQGHQWGRGKRPELALQSKESLLQILEDTDVKLLQFLSDANNLQKVVSVKWSNHPIPVLNYFWALNDHEILHNGWNLALMDVLNIPRFAQLKQVWG